MQKPCSRKVTDAGNGCKSVSLPAKFAEHFDVEVGDDVPMEHNFDDGTVTFRLAEAEAEH